MNIHLHVLLHGLWGSTKHLESAVRVFLARHGQPESVHAVESQERVQLLLIEANEGTKTYDGIDWGAERAVEEIQNALCAISTKGDRVTKFSLMGYSLGGLHARYVVAILYTKNFFDIVQAVNFTTFATPHMGIPHINHSLFSRISKYVGVRMLGNTGKQLYCLDCWGETGRPLLEVMADRDFVFWRALNAFRNIDIYANAVHDRMVPYVSGAFELLDPFEAHIDKIQVEFDSDYHPMLKSWSLNNDKKVKGDFSLVECLRAWKPLPFMGPFIQWNFPCNLILMALLPIIIPVLVILLPVTFVINTRSSGIRVKSLERASMSAQERLVQIFTTLDHTITQVEDTLAQANRTPANTEAQTMSRKRKLAKKNLIASESDLPASMQKMATDLNELSVRKHLAWFHPTRNSHAIIICREQDQFSGHALGEAVLRHWADHFVL